MNSQQLKKLIKECILNEALQLKRHDDKIVAVSDLSDRKSASSETFKNKDKLKAAGFRWDDRLNSWTISKYKIADAQSVIAKINKSVTSKLIAAVEDLPEFIMNSDNVSKKSELAQKIDGFVEELGKQASEAAVSEEIQRFLEFNRKFRTFSLNNTLLIFLQKPSASKVAGFRQWEIKFNRKIKKGAKAITIFAPIKQRESEDIDDSGFDDAVRRNYVYRFRAVNVFDIGDTEPIPGKEDLANVKTPEWHDNNTPNETADKLFSYTSQLASELNVKMTTTDSERGEMGYAKGDHINLSSDVSGVNRISTLIHEIAHELMHFDKTSIFYIGEDDAANRQKKELQAETVSYVVLRHYNISVKHHATYIALWNKNKDVAASVKENLQLIRSVSNFIIDRIDKIADEKPTGGNTSPTGSINQQ